MAIAPTKLVVARTIAEDRIRDRINKGYEIRNKDIFTPMDLNNARSARDKWSEYNTEMLKGLFSTASIADEYAKSPSVVVGFWNATFVERVEDFRERMDDPIRRLESILERLELYEEASVTQVQENQVAGKIFIVHGHDDVSREAVARFCEKLGLKTIILQERPNAGRTIIEKFEAESANVGFAIVLLTPDDVGAAKSNPSDAQFRARQNVLFEMGYFVAKLGRGRVCMLSKSDVEIPSDLHGVLSVPMDSGSGWKLKLAQEMKAAGLDVDLNKAF